jgi:uncharacterized protein
VFIGFLPLVPLQTLIALVLAFVFRLNRLTVFAGTMVWQPFSAPFILAAELAAGRWMLGPSAAGRLGFAGWGDALVMGAPLVSAAAGLLSGTVAWLLFRRHHRRNSSSNVLQEREGEV